MVVIKLYFKFIHSRNEKYKIIDFILYCIRYWMFDMIF